MESTSLLNKVKNTIEDTYHITSNGIYNKLENFNIVKLPISATNKLKLKTTMEVKENKKTKLFIDSVDSIMSENSDKAYTLKVKTGKILMFEKTQYVGNYHYGLNSDIEIDIIEKLENVGRIYSNLINYTINNMVSSKLTNVEKEYTPVNIKYHKDIMVKGGKKIN